MAGGLRGGHALDALVDILVQRRAAVGGDDNVGIRRLYLRVAEQEVAAGPVRRDIVAGKGRHSLLVLVDDDVDDVGELRHGRGRDHVLVHRVAVEDAGARIRAVDEAAAVIAHHRDLVADAGQHALAPAGKAREEVRLDEALGDQQLRLGGEPVDHAGRAGGQNAHPDVRRGIPAVVDDDAALPIQLVAELYAQLLLRAGAMEARGHQQRDLDIRAALPQLPEHVRQDIPAGDRARMVGNDDDAVFSAPGQLRKARAVDRMLHRLSDDGQAVAPGLQLADPGTQNLRISLFKGDRAGAIGNLKHRPSLLFILYSFCLQDSI